MKPMSGGQEDRILIFIYQRLIRLYPIEFRNEYGPEMDQVFKDMLRYSDQKFSRWRLASVCQAVFPDLIISIIYEQLCMGRTNMKDKTSIIKVFGLVILSSWVFIWSWGLLRAFLGPGISDPSHFLLGDSFTEFQRVILEFFLMFGPGITLITFLFPLLRVKNNPDDGMVIEIAVHQAKPISRFIIGACGAITLILFFAMILGSRFL